MSTTHIIFQIADGTLGVSSPVHGEQLEEFFHFFRTDSQASGKHLDCKVSICPSLEISNTARYPTHSQKNNARLELTDHHTYRGIIDLKNHTAELYIGAKPKARKLPSGLLHGLMALCQNWFTRQHGYLFVHSVAFTMPNRVEQGVLCPAKSGTGKSTLGKQLERSRTLNDDCNIISLENDVPWVYSSPFRGKEGLAWNPQKKRLRSLLKLIQSEQSFTHPIHQSDALRSLLENTWQAHGCPKTETQILQRALTITQKLSAFEFHFNLKSTDSLKTLHALQVWIYAQACKSWKYHKRYTPLLIFFFTRWRRGHHSIENLFFH